MKTLFPLILIAALLSACSREEHEDLQQWMKENAKDLRGNIPKLPPVVPFVPIAYTPDGLQDPFSPGKIEPESRSGRGNAGGKFQPNFEARELRNNLLEKYPLESIKMIGFLNLKNQPMAVVQVEQHVKQVKVGDYLGQDFGIIIHLSEREISLRELVQDASGDWTERTSTLQLQGKEGGKK